MQKKRKIRLTVALCLCAAVLVCAVGVPAVQYHTGLRALRQEDYGKVLFTGNNDFGQGDAQAWGNIQTNNTTGN